MKVLIIGGANTVTDMLIHKLSKEGVRIYVLSGGHKTENRYKRVYEQYNFSYENNCAKEIFESVRPDITIFTGAFDNNFNWNNTYRESTAYCSGLYNILNAYALLGHGRFIYLSSDEIYNITEEEYRIITQDQQLGNDRRDYAYAYKAKAVKSGEDICNNYQATTGLDIVTIRIEGLCYEPKNASEAYDVCSRMCVEALSDNTITMTQEYYSPLYISDAVEFLYRFSIKENLKYTCYQMDSDSCMTQEKLAAYIDTALEITTEKKTDTKENYIWLDNASMHNIREEMSAKVFSDAQACADIIIKHIKKHKERFVNQKNKGISSTSRLWQYITRIFWVMLPFMENCICFIPFFMINNRVTGSQYFAKLDCYLLYVLLFAIVYGQQQAAFSATLSVCGYVFRQMYSRSSFEIVLDYNTYVWVAQIMILGLTVGYLRDQLRLQKADKADELSYYASRLKDIEDINNINVRLKDELETQIVNQSDSLGKIFEITSSLDGDEPEIVFFHAAEVVSQLMNCKDVAIYNVSNRSYARLMSATSANARKLGNSIEYTGYTDMYEALKAGAVYINKKLTPEYPLMATAIMSEDEIQSIIMLWDVAWERMNLSQTNRFKVIGYLIQNAVLRADRYIDMLENQRYIEGTRILDAAAFRTLLNAFIGARKKGLADCSIIRITPDEHGMEATSKSLEKLFRNSDYLGSLDDGYLYVLLANTNNQGAGYVTKRIGEAGYVYDILREV